MTLPPQPESGSPPHREPFLSKSAYLCGLQCAKRLWFRHHAPWEVPDTDAAAPSLFEQGREVGALARSLFPEGIEVAPGITDFEETVRQTRAALRMRRPLFEAAFLSAGAYARADVLRPAPGGAWDMFEVKSATRVQDIHVYELAFQAWVLTQAGVPLRDCFLLHVDPRFVRHGPVRATQFFKRALLTPRVRALWDVVEEQVSGMFAVLRRSAPPPVDIGPQCAQPERCPLHDRCWAFLPEQSVMELYRGARKGFALLAAGTTGLGDIPEGFRLTVSQRIQREAARTGEPHVNPRGLAAFLDKLRPPLHFLDFETVGTAIPLFDGVRPYQQVPFQFSLHVERAPGAPPGHRGFLAGGREDPRREFMERLRQEIGPKGSIVAYNAKFELGRLRECGACLPEFASWLEQIESRVVDLLEPFRAFHYYHPRQRGSASLKAVLPALTGRGYDGLAIPDGETAGREFLRVTFGEVPPEERSRVRRQLEAYCGLDTEGMVWIVAALRQLVSGRGFIPAAVSTVRNP